MLTLEQRQRLREIEDMLERIAKGASADETLRLTNRITEAFAEYRNLRPQRIGSRSTASGAARRD